ncbi:MAG: agmatinase [Deltaproteobacteria bacterium]|nr:agmatinase [Deltaproteobacteria bacterium]
MLYMGSRGQGDICIIGVPFDSTASFRPGARFAPNAIREASYCLEMYSPGQDISLEDVSFMDSGDMELPPGDPFPALDMIETEVSTCIKEGKTPFVIGGEHTLSLGSVRAVTKTYPGLKVIQLDAHADLRDKYLGQKLSHATVMKRIIETIGDDCLRQIGIRSFTREESGLVRSLCVDTTGKLLDWAKGSPCYITCDLDILDPSVLPGTGAPEPGGISFNELVNMLLDLIYNLNIVGIDIVELAPNIDVSGSSSVVAAKVVRECLLAIGKKESEKDKKAI